MLRGQGGESRVEKGQGDPDRGASGAEEEGWTWKLATVLLSNSIRSRLVNRAGPVARTPLGLNDKVLFGEWTARSGHQ